MVSLGARQSVSQLEYCSDLHNGNHMLSCELLLSLAHFPEASKFRD